MKTINFNKIKEKGSVIIYTIIILSAVTMISLALLRLLIPKFVVVRESLYSTIALYAADSAIELCIFNARVDPGSAGNAPSLSVLVANYTTPGVTVQSIPASCPYNLAGSVNVRTVGSYRGISRSLEAF